MADPRALRAPAKLNLGLRVGAADGTGLHPLRSLFCPLELSDRLTVRQAEADAVVCAEVDAPNLAESALRALRDAGWDEPPLRIEIEKRIPIAAGLGGGSADAAAVLRLAAGAVGVVEEIARSLGSDVPSQLEPRPVIVGGHGERLSPVALRGGAGVVLIPSARGLSTAAVYERADEVGIGAGEDELERWEHDLRAALEGAAGPIALGGLLVNDLEPAAVSLLPEITDALEALDQVGAGARFVCGSGPTVAGLFDDLPSADRAAGALAPRWAGALVTALDTAPVL